MAKAVLVISYNQPDDTEEGFEKVKRISQSIRDLFKDESDVEVRVAIRETADEVLDIFEAGT